MCLNLKMNGIPLDGLIELKLALGTATCLVQDGSLRRTASQRLEHRPGPELLTSREMSKVS